jgi:acyl carrier protein
MLRGGAPALSSASPDCPPVAAFQQTGDTVTDAEKLDEVLRTELMLPADVDLTGIAYGRTETWDSVAHMQLVVALEDAFGISLSEDDVLEISSYPATVRVLRDRHGIALAA